MKVEKSSKECAEYNTSHQAEIDLGLIFPLEPSDRVLEREAKAAKEREEQARGERERAAVIAQIQTVNPTGVRLGLEAVYSGGSSYSCGYHSGWKLIIGDGYGQDANKKWMAIGEGKRLIVTEKQLGKAKEKIAEVAAVNAAEAARRNARQNVQQRTEAFIAGNQEFCKLVGHTAYNSGETYYYGSGMNRRASYQTAFLVNEDGSVKIGGETFQPSQWVEIYTLRAQQAEAMKALKDSFKTTVAVAA